MAHRNSIFTVVTNSKNMRAHNTYYDCRMQLSVLLAAVVVNT